MLWLALAVLPAPQETIYFVDGTDFSPLPGIGHAVSSVDDLNGDGARELLIGSPYDGAGGEVQVLSGADGTPLFPTLTTVGATHHGYDVTEVGDVDGDGFSDIAIGSPSFGGVGPGGPGQVRIVSGATGLELYARVGDNAGDELGHSVAGIGDVDLDGFPDFAAGATHNHELTSGPGYVRIFSGATGATLQTVSPMPSGRRFGATLAGIGDVNADAQPDYLIGAPGQIGTVQCRSGALASLLWSRNGPGSNSGYGWDVDGAGDVDGDGIDDVILGAAWSGLAHIRRATDGVIVYTVTGPQDDFFGGAVAGLGDQNGDGFADFAIGGKWIDGPEDPFTGATYVYSGRQGLLRGIYYGAGNGDNGGFSLANLGDVNGDGIDDLATGLPGAGPSNIGRVRVEDVQFGQRRVRSPERLR